jgi:hypothetical protein
LPVDIGEQYGIRLIGSPSRRIAISESVLSDFNGLRRHFRVGSLPLAARSGRASPMTSASRRAATSEKQNTRP